MTTDESTQHSTLRRLYASLSERRRPEDVAEMILELRGESLSPQERRVLQRAARGSLRHLLFGYTSMAQEFARPVGAQQQMATAGDLFETLAPLPPEQCDDPEAVESYVRRAGREIRKRFGENDFKQDRLNRAQRAAADLDLSRRRYNKLFRLLTRMEDKLSTMTREMKKRELTMVGKSGLASTLSWEEFAADVDSACFIAYLTARSNLRSEFTAGRQQRAYDEIADTLFQRCGPRANWWAIAHVYPKPEVLARLSDEQKGQLIGRWLGLLYEIAELLRETWNRSDLNLATMIVRRGDDSTTWNNLASAWNKARDNWIALLYALGLDEVLDHLCPGKVLRLMAADVAAWHQRKGGDVHPDTLVWRRLPPPWDVLTGREFSSRATIEEICRAVDIDPYQTGWIAARPRTAVAAYRPTPELVHGVAVASPFVAKVLRDAGWYSGKPKSRPAGGAR